MPYIPDDTGPVTGDIMRCVEPDETGTITQGATYTISRVSRKGGILGYVVYDDIRKYSWHPASCFE